MATAKVLLIFVRMDMFVYVDDELEIHIFMSEKLKDVKLFDLSTLISSSPLFFKFVILSLVGRNAVFWQIVVYH